MDKYEFDYLTSCCGAEFEILNCVVFNEPHTEIQEITRKLIDLKNQSSSPQTYKRILNLFHGVATSE